MGQFTNIDIWKKQHVITTDFFMLAYFEFVLQFNYFYVKINKLCLYFSPPNLKL